MVLKVRGRRHNECSVKLPGVCTDKCIYARMVRIQSMSTLPSLLPVLISMDGCTWSTWYLILIN